MPIEESDLDPDAPQPARRRTEQDAEPEPERGPAGDRGPTLVDRGPRGDRGPDNRRGWGSGQ